MVSVQLLNIERKINDAVLLTETKVKRMYEGN